MPRIRLMASLFPYAELVPDEWRMDFVYERTELRTFNPHQVETWLHEVSKDGSLYARHHPSLKQRKNVSCNGKILYSHTTLFICILIRYVDNTVPDPGLLTF